jgi:tetratricopeptide (TPR) repeat protein
MSADFVNRAEQLAAAGRWAEVSAVLEPLIEDARSAGLWSMLGMARLRTGNHSAAADSFVRAASLDAEGGRAWLNAASVLSQVGRMADAAEAAQRAISFGFAPPEAHLLLGRALQRSGDLDGAEAAFEAAIASRRAFAAAHRELAQLLWMRSGDLERATERLNVAIAAHPADTELRDVLMRLLKAAGDESGAQSAAAGLLETMPPGAGRRLFEAQEADLRGDYAAAAEAARDAARMGADFSQSLEALASAQLAMGDAVGLLATADEWLGHEEFNQLAIGYRASALRMLGDPRGDAFRDYERLVRPFDVDVPAQWAGMDAFLTDLAAALSRLHPFEAPPLGQSIRGGSQTMEPLFQSTDPAIRGFFQAIDGPIRRYMAELGTGSDPLRVRNRGAYAIKGSWSVWLGPGGFHVDHVHPQGWISSACYIQTPKASEDSERREGWIRFGQPPVQPPGGLSAEYFVEPRPGRLVLFPAWMWHGTVPFTSDERRLTVAFDALPA